MSELLKEISVLFEGIDVSDDQKVKFQTNLEAVISEKVSAYKEELLAGQETQIAEKVEEQTKDITDKVDDYLEYVVEEWSTDNKLAIENGIKLEIMESFVEGMKTLFTEHYVDIPEGKDDLVTVAEAKVVELQDDLNEAIEKNITMKKSIVDGKKAVVLEAAAVDLTETQKEKFGALVEDIDSSDIAIFETKVQTIRESFFKSDKKSDEKDELIDDRGDDRMSAYVNAL